jgi:flavin-dependent dehydrogenase
MGGGPAGSLFSYFLLELAAKLELDIRLDIYEPRNFSLTGPPGCNMCAGIISESLVQMLAVEGIPLPPTVVQRGMDSYILHTDHGKTRFETPKLEKRIAAVFRGAGPLTTEDSEWQSFDGYLLDQAVSKGARLNRSRVKKVNRLEDQLEVEARGGPAILYEFLAVATGVNTSALRLFQPLEPDFQPPETVQTYVREYYVGKEAIEQAMGAHTIHFFFLNSPGLDFAAIVPKGNFVTVTALGQDLDQNRFEKFLDTPAVASCMPPNWQGKEFVCHCSPRINVTGAINWRGL